VPKAGRLKEQVENHRKASSIQVLFLRKAELEFFHFLEIVTSWYLLLIRKSQYSLVGIFRKIPLAENRFLQAGKGAKNTKEKSRQCFTTFEFLIYSIFNLHHVLFKLMKII